MATPTIPNGEEYFFPIIYEGNGAGQRVGKFVPFTNNGTIDNSCIFNSPDSPVLSRTPSGTGTSKKTFTISAWIKNGRLINSASNHSRVIYGVNHGSASRYGIFGLYNGGSGNADKLRLFLGKYTTGSSTTGYDWYTNRTLEDTSKWYHVMAVVDTTDATAGDRVKLYIDGDRVTSFASSSNPSLNDEFYFGSEHNNYVSTYDGSFGDWDGYIAEFNFVDGTALDPSTFGVTDTSTGRWIPKTLSGITYGTNGFRLEFGDSSALGDDTSGNTNDFTATNLASTDQTTDSPTSNHNNMGGSINSGNSNAEGNLETTTASSGTGYIQTVALPAFGVNKGKWYWEVKVTTVGTALYGWKDDGNAGGSQASTSGTIGSGGNFAGALSAGSSGSYSAGSWFIDHDYNNEVNYTTVATNDVLMFALDLDNNKGYCGKNGTWFNSADPANGTGAIGGTQRANGVNKFYPMVARMGNSSSVGEWNFGQRTFAYSAPTGFSALQQDNLPTTDKGISGLTWTKNRDGTDWHYLVDSSRGNTKALNPNDTAAEETHQDGVQKFLKGGISVEDRDNVNKSGNSFVNWTWVANGGTTASNTDGSITSTVQANTTAGFSIVQYTGTGSAATVGHGLSSAPEWFIVKGVSNTDAWVNSHIGLTSQATYSIALNYSNAEYSGAGTFYWNNTAPTSSVFSIATDTAVNGSSRTYVAYCWHSVDGFSKFGKYTGNGSTDGPFIYTGFKPAWLMTKRSDAINDWQIFDATRNPFNPVDRRLYSNLTNAEAVGSTSDIFDFTANGFKVREDNAAINASGGTYIYMAFAEHPFVGDGTSPVTAR